MDVTKIEAEKILIHRPYKYIERMWNVQIKVILVIIKETGTISKSFRKIPQHIEKAQY
jgi:hypothetical protein